MSEFGTGAKPSLSGTPRIMVPPQVFANADMVSGMFFGKPPAAAFTSYSARSVPAFFMRLTATARDSSSVMYLMPPNVLRNSDREDFLSS